MLRIGLIICFGQIGALGIDQSALYKLLIRTENNKIFPILHATAMHHYRGGSLEFDDWELEVLCDTELLWCFIDLSFGPSS